MHRLAHALGRFAPFVLACALAAPRAAVADPAACALVVPELMKLSGVTDLLAAFPAFLDEASLRSDPDLPEPLIGAARALYAEAYAPARLAAGVRERLTRGCDAGRMAAALEQLRSPLARRFVALDAAASTPEAFRATQALAARLDSLPASDGRLRLVRRLEAATEATDTTLTAMLQPALAIALAGEAAAQARGGAARGDAALRTRLEAERARARPAAERLTLASFLYAYREVALPELEAYVRWNESDLGRWTQRTLTRALLATLGDAALHFADGVVQELPRARGARSS
jgi:hypothetical protein